MRKLWFLTALIMVNFSCTVFEKHNLSSEVLMTVENEPVNAGEFMYVYEKNNFNNDSIYYPEDVDAYFKLFRDFKLKIKAAKDLGIDTTSAFINEYNGYKKQLLRPYLAETREQEKLVREAYERMQYEIDASHILIKVPENATPQDTLAAYQKMLEIHERAKSGEDFTALAVKYSEDPSVKMNKGRLGYFTVFQMVYSFENAAYHTPLDSVSDIFRTRFGYHILKVNDKRPYSGRIKVSHIMLLTTGKGKEEPAIRESIFAIHDALANGADWDEMCRQYSEDMRTKDNGGTLPFIGLRQINDEAFENAAFSLSEPGEISDPVRSRFGWHIIRLDEREGLKPFDELKDEIASKVSKDGRAQLSRMAVIEKLKKQNHFMEYEAARQKLVAMADSTLLQGKWRPDTESIPADTLFTITQKPYTIDKAVKSIITMQRSRKGVSPGQYMNELINRYENNSILEYEEASVVQHDFDLRMLLQEYYEGILLFDIMNRKVWNKAVQDTAGLRKYFEDHRSKYYWNERAKATIVSSADKAVTDEVKNIIDHEKYAIFSLTLAADANEGVVDNPSLDSLVSLYFRYTPAAIEISYSDNTPKVYPALRQFLKDMQIPDEAIRTHKTATDADKIVIELNSKSKKSLEYLYNKESALTLRVREGKFERGDDPLIDSISWKPGLYEIMKNNRNFLVLIHEILARQPPELEEIKGKVITDYQDFLEDAWLEELRSKYSVKVNYSTFDKIKKSFKKKLHTSD